MVQQPGKISATERAQYLAAILVHEGVLAACAGYDRLMKMPSGRDNVRKFRPAHEGRVITMAAADLLHGAAQQDHVVGRLQAHRRLESEFALARAEFDFDRSQ